MMTTELDPVTLSAEELMRMDLHALHQLARMTSGTLSRYRALLGRLLLAIQRREAFTQYGCSSAAHYAVNHLGLPRREAAHLLQVARRLEGLPRLRMLANAGQIDWSKLREVVRVATAETEGEWAELCGVRTYAEIEDLVARSERGEVPPDRPVRVGPRSELRFRFEPEQMAVLERGLQALCQREGRQLSMDEAIELLFAEQLSSRPVDDAELKKVRSESVNDLNWSERVDTSLEPCPGNDQIRIVNPDSRVPSEAQRRRLLRRDGYRCAVPGCENHLWLHLHHLVYYSYGGKTEPENLLTICTRCHKNLHEGRLRIEGSAPHGLRFLTAEGKDIRTERWLEVSFWLDIWCGRLGEEDDEPRYVRAKNALLN